MQGRGGIIDGIVGKASARDGVTAQAVALSSVPEGTATPLGMIGGSGARTTDTGFRHFLNVQPEQPQELVWLVPQVGVDYTIEASKGLKWLIQ